MPLLQTAHHPALGIIAVARPFPCSQAVVTVWQNSANERGEIRPVPLVHIAPMNTTVEFARAYAQAILNACNAIDPQPEMMELEF